MYIYIYIYIYTCIHMYIYIYIYSELSGSIPSTTQAELEMNRKCKEEVATPRKNPSQRKRINRVPFNGFHALR